MLPADKRSAQYSESEPEWEGRQGQHRKDDEDGPPLVKGGMDIGLMNGQLNAEEERKQTGIE